MSLLTDALAIHASRLKASAGEVVTYTRGGDAVTLTAVAGQTTFEELGVDGEVRTQTKSVDFIIAAGDLTISGNAEEPKRGDKITRANGDMYDLLPGSNGNHWSWNDGNQTQMRIHTVRRVKS